ncbi:hypothetical protein [Sphingomonas morindae]|uniref:Uncharacterized protein n=1 Tax=Sphingomonas morindae TaxID=1541170 RepID=A0ABY4X8L6_9SPHN|nr:hypothetical protein [Sphingomonas morindae]USI73272.1 hypothetical protein LHA26_01980 [Sphingomonas morindae]
MELHFTKRAGRFDTLILIRPTGEPETIACPKQGIIPHDMVHYAVETVLGRRGFLARVAEGGAADFTAPGEVDEAAIERLVECVQAELWGGPVPAADLIAMYEQACGARGHGAIAVTHAGIEAIRARLEDLSRAWSALPPNETMRLRV